MSITILNDQWQIKSNLDITNTNYIYKKYKSELPSSVKSAWIIDFKTCKHIDSAGLSLIIEFIKHAKAKDINLQFMHLNNNAIALANVHGIGELIQEYTKQ